MSEPSAEPGDSGAALLALYDTALPHVYGYLMARCDGTAVAEYLTAETFLAAVDAARRADPPVMTIPWMVGVARHKLVDHWRRKARDERRLRALADVDADPPADDWDARLDTVRAHEALTRLGAHHRGALTLRYLDDLSVREVAEAMGRTVYATRGAAGTGPHRVPRRLWRGGRRCLTHSRRCAPRRSHGPRPVVRLDPAHPPRAGAPTSERSHRVRPDTRS